MKVVSHTADSAVVRFEGWELHLILASTRWILERWGTGRDGQAEVSTVIGLWMEDAEASFRNIGRLDAYEPVELSKMDLIAAHGFVGEAVYRYLPLQIIANDREFERLMGVEPSEARNLITELRDLMRTSR